MGEKNRSHALPLKERGVFVQIKKAEDARGGVATATSHKSRPQADAELGEKNRSHAAGFTLLEVMIALAIIGVALVALLGLAQRSISTNQRLQQITRATLLAQSKMAEVETGIGNDGSDGEGTFTEPDDAFSWTVRSSETPVEGVRQVEVTVFWGREEKNESVHLISFLQRGGAG
ncbi:type II secretion system minor pseudopilin GspI [Geothermobacter hydrogeniphilus]|nr:type II secretion system minor pseudopilin GspI [Geothermobacter hydrogeniphilus]